MVEKERERWQTGGEKGGTKLEGESRFSEERRKGGMGKEKGAFECQEMRKLLMRESRAGWERQNGNEMKGNINYQAKCVLYVCH